MDLYLELKYQLNVTSWKKRVKWCKELKGERKRTFAEYWRVHALSFLNGLRYTAAMIRRTAGKESESCFTWRLFIFRLRACKDGERKRNHSYSKWMSHWHRTGWTELSVATVYDDLLMMRRVVLSRKMGCRKMLWGSKRVWDGPSEKKIGTACFVGANAVVHLSTADFRLSGHLFYVNQFKNVGGLHRL